MNNISFGKPYKKVKKLILKNGDMPITKYVYYIDIFYKKQPLYIKLPESAYVIKDYLNQKQGTCHLNIDNDFYNFIKLLENHIINSIYINSKEWFGKSFSIDKISKCIVSNIIKDDKCTLLTNKINNKSNFPYNFIILKDLQFIDNRFTYNARLIVLVFF